jgi:(p)ppGpp synthase/HD superfamily hydrolase
VLTGHFSDALVYAADVHAGQLRKGGDVPYLAHLLGVTALVLEDGGSEDEAIAALLHDALEDRGDRTSFEDIRDRFGEPVALIVRACSDTEVRPKPPWDERKRAYLERLETEPPEVLRVSVADKLYNARAIVLDHRQIGDQVWERFGSGRPSQMWYYRSVADLFLRRYPGAMADELDRTVRELESFAP